MKGLIRCFGSIKGVRLSWCFTARKMQCGQRRLSIKSNTVPPILSVAPIRGLVDEKFKVLVENLPPAFPITIYSLHQSEDQNYWEAYGHYMSDHRGIVCVSEDMSFGGTYRGKEPMGLLWSMRPLPGSRKGLRLRKIDVEIPMLVNISVYSGHEGFREQVPLASALTERWHKAPGVRRIDLTEKGVQGTLLIPPGPGPFPGVLDIWGAGGGLLEYRAALLASHGYAALALENLTLTDLQTEDPKLNYFEKAFDVLKNHPQVIPDRVGVLGLSLGSIVIFYLMAESPTFKPCCCVSVSGSHSYSRDKTLKGIYKELLRLDENNYQVWRDVGLEILKDPTNKVDVGKIECPLLLINAIDDQNWPTTEFAKHMAQMIRAAGKEHLLTIVDYPDSGHLIEPPFSPHFRATKFIVNSSTEKAILLWGGQPKPHSDAQEDSWRKILSFLKQHLYGSPHKML
uniref:Acyl-CoA thioesterase 16 n=1 Tax=Anabas testudineus TaxID=64144 RepID=A0A7N6A6J1_ANATE